MIVFYFILLFLGIFFIFWHIGLIILLLIDIFLYPIKDPKRAAAIIAAILTTGITVYGMFNCDQESTVSSDKMNTSYQCTCECGCVEKGAEETYKGGNNDD